MINIVILAAGLGSRLGRDIPKPLTELADGRTIMQQQVDNINEAFGEKNINLNIVVGYKLELIIEARPDASFIYNESYDMTNTSKSLMRALKALPSNEGVLWLNGDVVFNPEILKKAAKLIAKDQSFVAVDTSSVGEEEVKYTTDAEGFIDNISKIIDTDSALGEAVGINYISSTDNKTLQYWLKKVNDNDYFEKALELAIKTDKVLIQPFDISSRGWYAVEVDFEEDLQRANLVAI